MSIPLKKKKEKNILNDEKTGILSKINNALLQLGGIPLKEKLFFVRQLQVMLKAGISMLTALKTLSAQTKNKLFEYILKDVTANIEEGNTLTKSLRIHEKHFGELFINMVESGEISGKLEEILERLYLQIKKQHELTSKVKGALTYPAVIVVAMLGIGSFMMAFVVPKLTVVFKEYDTELPILTRVLINVSDFVALNGVLVGISIIVTIILFIKILKTKRGLFLFQGLLLKLPILSPIIKQINLARFSRTVSSLLKTDIMIVKTFEITANVVGNLHYRKALLEVSEKIKEGSPINEAIKKNPKLFTPIISQMITVGEQTGELDTILEEIAIFYEDEVDKIMENLPAIIEPILILVLGIGVGVVAVALIMPMYSLTSTI